MTDDTILHASHTHLFRGARVAGTPQPGPVLIAFTDGQLVDAELHGNDPLILDVDEHRTASGTAIPAKAWLVTIEPHGLVVRDRVS